MTFTKTIFTAFTLSLTITLMTPALSADFKLKNIRVGGLGCPSEMTQIILAPDSSAASLIFQQFESRVPVLDVGPKVQRNISILNCNIFIDVQIDAGVKLEAIDLSYDVRGFATLDQGVQGSFKSLLIGRSGLGTDQRPTGPQVIAEKNWVNSHDSQEEDFTVTSTKSIPIPSLCSRGSSGDVVSIRLQNTLSTQILSRMDTQSQGSITVDTSDIKGGIKIKAHTSSCRNSRVPVIVPADRNERSKERSCRVVIVHGRPQQVCQ